MLFLSLSRRAVSFSTKLVNKTNMGITVEGGQDMARSAEQIFHRDVQTGSTLVARWKLVVKKYRWILESFVLSGERADGSLC